MVSATYIGNLSVSPKTVVSGYLRPKSGANTMTLGSTMQMTAYVTYSDGSTGTLPDAHGNVVTAWNTTNHGVAKISSLGHATALAAGSINMEGMVGPLKLTQWTVKVGAAPVPAAPSAPAAAIAASPAANVQPAVQRPCCSTSGFPWRRYAASWSASHPDRAYGAHSRTVTGRSRSSSCGCLPGTILDAGDSSRRVGCHFEFSPFYRSSRRRKPRPATSVQPGRACRAGDRQ